MSSKEIFSYLQEHPLLRGIPDNELQIAASSIQPIDFMDGQPLLIEGEIGTECYFIRTGNVEVSSRNLIGKSMLLAELGPGALVGEIGLLQNERRTARVTAIGEVTALRLERQLFEQLSESSPLFYESMMLTLNIRMIHRKLRNATIWSAIPDAELRGLAEVTVIQKVARGETIVAEGALSDQFYMVSKGSFEVNGKKRKRTVLLEGDFFGEEMLLTETPSDIAIVASEDSELLVMGKNEFLYVLSYYAPIQKQFMGVLHIRSPHLLSKVKSEFRGNSEQVSVENSSTLTKTRERWVDVLLWLGGSFIALSALALFLNNSWLNIVVMIVGGLVGPVTFVSYIRDHQLLGFRQTRLGMLFAASAIFAVPAAWFLERLWLFNSGLDFTQFRLPLSVSLIEESVKLLVCLLFIRKKQMHFLMDAIVFGAAAGMGFAAVESMIYGWSHMGEASSVGMLSVLWIRALLSPFGHGAWTAIAVAAIWIGVTSIKLKTNSNARIMYKVVSAFLLLLTVISLHALWDFDFVNGWGKVGAMIIIGFIDIILLYILIRIGRKEEIQSFTTMNPYVQEPLHHFDLDEKEDDELHCSGCGTVSPRSARYCARCGHALRIK
ncbi:cyclic nucleotide-binding domain-containing protein [Psychrobacillus sp.]|uniref:cyclic nucleotide-binding domain-containing protein n=1 Tax=Psychrobacillus sp. TaxID=1871623 RepID=UPI0028BD85F3|nr:cyclic nucleotide-binding domain-containing protein [Psychrobacillus sp.]